MSDIYAIAVPKWGIEMIEGTLNVWNKSIGDTISKGDEVLEMESDKIVNVWESPIDGVLRRVLVEEGDARPVGALLGVIASADVDDAVIDAFIADFGGAAPEAKPEEKPAAPAAGTAGPGGDAATRSSPVVRNLAQELGVDLNTVTGTGRRGRITEDDVRAASTGGDSSDDSGADVQIIPLSATRQTIAKRLTEAKQEIPHYYLSVEYKLDGLLAHRESLNASSDVRVSVNDLVLWCTARALMKEPRVNINVIDNAIHQFSQANLSVAMATADGLYPTTIRGADTMSPADIAKASTALAAKAQAGSLTREDLSGGSFTVSNLGMFGISNFTAIINPPMGAILALGKGEQKPVVVDGELTVATVVNATLSCDHRVIDGAVGASFLKALGDEIAELD